MVENLKTCRIIIPECIARNNRNNSSYAKVERLAVYDLKNVWFKNTNRELSLLTSC
jgi:hypothetical protein